MATDGLWDVFSNSEVIDFVLTRMLHGSDDLGAKALVDEAFRRGSVDNVSVLILDLRRAGGADAVAGEACPGS